MYWSISVPPPPPPYKFLSPLVISFSLSLSLPARLSFYLFLSHLISGNRIEARQWIVTRHLSCYNPLSCFTPFCGVKYDKMKFHEFFCVSNFFSYSPVTSSLFPLSLSPTLSLYLSLSLPLLSLYLSLSHPCRLPLLLPLMPPCLSFSYPCLSFSLSVAVSLPPPVSLRRVWRFLLPADHRIGGLICHSLVAWSPWFYIFIT